MAKMKELESTSKMLAPAKLNFVNEFKYFESTGTRGPTLELLYKALLSIKPTSVESERAFSSAGIFTTKIRARLASNTIDALCFIRDYFKNAM